MKTTIIRFAERMPGGERLLRALRNYRHRRFVGSATTPEEVFTLYYDNNSWECGETVSGPGSTLESTANIRREIPVLIRKLGVRRLFDAPCGDYHWFREVERGDDVAYVGADIVKPMIERNQQRYGDHRTSFCQIDITKDPLPAADVWLCRDALFHLSYRDIARAIRNFLRSDIRYLLATSHTECRWNHDIPTGGARLLNLELPPFRFPPPLQSIEDWIEGSSVRSLCLWERGPLCSHLSQNEAFAGRRSGGHIQL